MNRQHKVEIVESLHHDFAESAASFVVGVQGLTVAQMQKLRAELRTKGGKLKVAKARLMKLAARDMQCQDDLMPYFKQQIGLVFATQEAPAVAKVLHDFSKDNQALLLITGCVENKVLTPDTIIRIAQLPSREVLLSQLCGTLKATLVRMLWTLKQVGETKQQ